MIDPANPGTPENPIPTTDPLNIIPDVATTDGATPAPIEVGSFVVDPDGEPLIFTATGLPPGMVIDPATGIITGTPPADASQTPVTRRVHGHRHGDRSRWRLGADHRHLHRRQPAAGRGR